MSDASPFDNVGAKLRWMPAEHVSGASSLLREHLVWLLQFSRTLRFVGIRDVVRLYLPSTACTQAVCLDPVHADSDLRDGNACERRVSLAHSDEPCKPCLLFAEMFMESFDVALQPIQFAF
eukprot:6198983-Pleurochrysis_carterae.AAC.9